MEATVNWADAGTCNVTGGGTPGIGFFNKVTMDGDSDSTDNNDACVPVVPTPKFAVEKSAQDGQGGFVAPGTTGPSVQVGTDGRVTVTYRVRVTNTGYVAAPHPAISDQLTLPAGFTIDSLTLQAPGGQPVSQGTSGAFTIPAGTSPQTVNAYADYIVVVTGVANLDTINWTSAGTCNTTGDGTPGTGFFNRVTLTGDSDGTHNNDACVPVTPPVRISLTKFGQHCDTGQPTCQMTGASFALYTQDPSVGTASPVTNGIVANTTNGALFQSNWLLYDTDYWLVETQAPVGHNLLATPIKFQVIKDATGQPQVVLGGSYGDVVKVSGTNALSLEVYDQTKAELPQAGGRGPILNAVIGMMLIAGAAIWIQRNRRTVEA